MLESQIVRITFLYDSLQVILRGVVDTGPTTFFLLIAVRHFQASDLTKSLLAAPTFLGMIFSLFAWNWLGKSTLPKSTLSAILRASVGIGFIVSSFVDNSLYYTISIVLTCLILPMNISLQPSLYRENYPVQIRGKVFGWSMVLNLLGSILFHWLIGLFLDKDITQYRYVLLLYGVAALFSAIFIAKIPSPVQKQNPKAYNWRRSFNLIVEDKFFGYM